MVRLNGKIFSMNTVSAVRPYKRHPIKNFIIMPRIQWEYIFKMMAMVSVTSMGTLLVVIIVYYAKFRTGYFYFLTDNMGGPIIKHTIWGLVIPSAVPAILLAILLGLYISLYSSRKIALPLFKIRRWAEAIFAGNLRHFVSLRKEDNLGELATACNQISKKFSQVLKEIDTTSQSEGSPDDRIRKIQDLLRKFEY